MKRKLLSKLLAASMAAAMTVGLVGCGGGDAGEKDSQKTDDSQKESQDDSQGGADTTATDNGGMATVITDENGNPYDLGGMEIIIRDWFSAETEPANDYEEARAEYIDWIEETYNFTIKEQAISDWGSTPQDFIDYATTGGEENYIFALRPDASVVSAMNSNLMYDLSTLDCLDFSEAKFTKNNVHKLYSKGTSVYAMLGGEAEPRTGLYFNKRLLQEAGVDPQEIYDLQENMQWTWDKFVEILEKVQRDTDSDGTIDVAGITMNNGVLYDAAVASNDGSYVNMENGKFVCTVDQQNTIDALEWSMNTVHQKYGLVYPQDAAWDYYKQGFLNGEAVFMPEDAYCAGSDPENGGHGWLKEMTDDFGFVCFPMGPNMTDYTNRLNDNLYCIPSCYDADKAWKLAFAYNLYTDPVPGYEDYSARKAGYYDRFRDTDAVDKTIVRMMSNGRLAYEGVLPGLVGDDWNNNFAWARNAGADTAALVEVAKGLINTCIEAAN